jgi:acyl-CoA thioester hydrolase
MSGGHRFQVRVYYEDTDFSGNVYHAAYLHFFERARTEFLRDEGIHHSELARAGIAFAVRSMEIDFLGAAHIDDLLEVETSVIAISGARLTLLQVLSRAGAELTRANVVVVAINAAGRAVRMPRALLARLTAG